jgi:hypothetical protein
MFKMRMQALIGALAVSLFAMTTQLNAGSFGIGVAASGMLVEASGQEKLKDTGVISKYGKTGQGVGVPSYYVQYTFGDDGFVVGIERVPGEASLGSKSSIRNDWKGGTATEPNNYQKAEAVLSGHTAYYIETPTFGPLFARFAYDEVALETQENLQTGAAYGDTDINGFTYGIGLRGTADNGIHMKLLAEYTDYDSFSITSTADDAGDSHTISGDVETTAIKLSIGYNF